MATKTVVLSIWGDVIYIHVHMQERGGHPEEREEAYAMELEVLSSNLSSGMCVQSWEGC